MEYVNPFADMQSDLDSAEVYDSVSKYSTPAPVVARFVEDCPKCQGKGKVVIGYTYTRMVNCFGCDGTGKLTFKTSPEKRKAARDSAQARREEAEQNRIRQQNIALELFTTEYPDVVEWLGKNTSDFARSLNESFVKYGHLTERQVQAVRNSIAKAKYWAEERKAAAPEVDVTKLTVAFNNAHQKGLKHPKIKLDDYTISRAPDSGKNPGALYIKAGDEYLGKVQDNRLQLMRTGERFKDSIVTLLADPEKIVAAYGIRTGHCAICSRELTDPASIDRGIGPICAEKFGW